MKVAATINYFINAKDITDPDRYTKARFFVISMFVFCLLGLTTIPATLFDPSVTNGLFWSNVFFTIVICCVVPFYRKFGGRILLVNIITLLGFTSNYTTYEISGGIYAPDNIWGIIVCCWVFLVSDKKSGLFWFFMTICAFAVFYYADLHQFKDFRAVSSKLSSHYHFLTYSVATLFIASIIYLYENGKEKFLTQLKDSKAEIEIKSKELELRNKDVTDSINYSKKIQYAVLPNEDSIYRSIPLSFILYKPKDIVSGDFFWFHEIDKDNYIFVCADCTGHGVPGAFMTVISSSLLNQTVIDNKIYEPAKILREVDRLLNMTLKQNNERHENVQDGMDLSLIKVNKATKEFIITSAKRPVVFIRDKQMQEFKGSKFSLGGMRTGEKTFEEIKLNYQEDDMLYFYTDGYHDQFGGEKGKKFSSKRLKELLMNIHLKSMPVQKQLLENEIDNWKGNLEQVDDICVVGIRF